MRIASSLVEVDEVSKNGGSEKLGMINSVKNKADSYNTSQTFNFSYSRYKVKVFVLDSFDASVEKMGVHNLI